MTEISRRKFVVAAAATLVATQASISWARPVSTVSDAGRAFGSNALPRPGGIVEREGKLIDCARRTRTWVARGGAHRIVIISDQRVHIDTPYTGGRDLSIQALRYGDANDEIRRCFGSVVLDELLYEVSNCQMLA